MADTHYAYDSSGLYSFETDDTGTVVKDDQGQPVITRIGSDDPDFVSATRQMSDGYADGTVQPFAFSKDGKVTGLDAQSSEQEFRRAVVRPAYDAITSQNIPEVQKYDNLHRAYGDDFQTIKIVAKEIGTDEAAKIWGPSTVTAAVDPSASPYQSVVVGSKSISNDRATQGRGSLPTTDATKTPAQKQDRPPSDQTPPTNRSPAQDSKTGGDPVILFSGQFYYQVTDLEVRGRGLDFKLVRTYLNQTNYRGPIGYCWDHSYNLWLREAQEIQADGSYANVVYRSNGQVRADRYLQIIGNGIDQPALLADIPDAVFDGPPGFFDRLYKTNGRYYLEQVTGIVIAYNDDLFAETITDANGNQIRLEYDADLRLFQVTDPVGKQFSFGYDELNRIRRVYDVEGNREVLYTFGSNGDLEGVDVRPIGEIAVEIDYQYSGPDVPEDLQHNLIAVIAPTGHVVLETEYGDNPGTIEFNRVVWQRSEAGEFLYEYSPIVDATDAGIDPSVDPVNYPWSSTTLTSPRGHVVESWFNNQGNVVLRREFLFVASTWIEAIARFRYNEDGLLIEETFADGAGTRYRYGREAFADLHGGDASGASPDARQLFGVLLQRVQTPRAGSGETRTVITDYAYTSARKLESQTGPYYADSLLTRLARQEAFEVANTWDTQGNLKQIDHPPVSLPDGTSQVIPSVSFSYDSHGSTTDIRIGSVRHHFDFFPDVKRSGFLSAAIQDADGVGLRTQFVVDNLGRVEKVTGPYGSVDRSEWNGFDLAKKRIREDPGLIPTTETIEYDANRRPLNGSIDIRDHNGDPIDGSPLRWIRTYDEHGRLIAQSAGPDGNPRARRKRLVLGPDGMVDREFDARDTETRYVRDELGRVVERVDAVGRAEESHHRFAYDIAGRLSSAFDANGNPSLLEYDGFGRLQKITGPDGIERSFTRDAVGRIVRAVLSGPNPSTGSLMRWSDREWSYDALGRLKQDTVHLFEPGAAAPDRLLVASFFFDPLGNLRTVTDAEGASTTYEQDGLGRLTHARDPDGNELFVERDDLQRTVTVTEKNVGEDLDGTQVTQFVQRREERDERGRISRAIDALGNADTVQYDSRDLPTRSVDPAGISTLLQRNVFGEVVSKSNDADHDPVVAGFIYDDNGNLAQLTDPSGNVIVFLVDAKNRVSRIERGTLIQTFSYDGDDRLLNAQDEQQIVLIQTLSPGGRLLGVRPDATQFIAPPSNPAYSPAPSADAQFSYWPDGSIATANNENANVSRFYDSFGRLLRETANGRSVQWKYDDVGRVTELKYPDGRTISFDHTPGGRLRAVRETATGSLYPGAAATAAKRVLATLHRVGDQVVGVELPGAVARISQDAGLRPIGADWASPTGALTIQERRLYGARGECRVEEFNDRLRTILFDEHLQEQRADDATGVPLVDVSALAPPATRGGLTQNGQADEDALTPAAGGIVDRSFGYSLDVTGNRVQTNETSGAAPPTATSYQLGQYDQYTSVGPDSVSHDLAGSVIAIGPTPFRYDPFHRLREAGSTKLAYDALGRLATVSGAGAPTEFVYAGLDRIEWRQAGAPVGQVVNASRRVCHLAIGGADYVPVHDLTGSIIEWNDDQGTQLGQTTYDPFGRVLSRTGTWPAPLCFRGQWRDDGAGIDLLFARPYSPGLGRFLQRDPSGFRDGFNLYSFAGNAPSTWSDQWGFDSHQNSTYDWGTVTSQGAKTLGLGLGLAATVGAAFAISNPFGWAVLGGFFLVSLYNSYVARAEEAERSPGVNVATGRVVRASLLDTFTFGLSYAAEGLGKQSLLTGLPLDRQTYSAKLGAGVGGALSLDLAPLALGAGRNLAWAATSYARTAPGSLTNLGLGSLPTEEGAIVIRTFPGARWNMRLGHNSVGLAGPGNTPATFYGQGLVRNPEIGTTFKTAFGGKLLGLISEEEAPEPGDPFNAVALRVSADQLGAAAAKTAELQLNPEPYGWQNNCVTNVATIARAAGFQPAWWARAPALLHSWAAGEASGPPPTAPPPVVVPPPSEEKK